MDNFEMGVNDVQVATETIEGQEGQQAQETNQQAQQVDTGVNNQAAAEPNNVEIAFSKRLQQERAKIENEFAPYKSFIESQAQMYGMSTQEYLQAVEQERQAQERQKYIDQGINPDLINEILENHPDIQYARELKAKEQENAKFDSEAMELFNEFPDLQVDDIPAEVFHLQQEKGLSLLDAYLRVNYKTMTKQAEQNTIRKLQNNALNTPGALGNDSPEHNTRVKDLSTTDFKKLQERVLRGENITL